MNSGLALRSVAWLIALALLALPVIGLMQGWFAAQRWPIRSLQVRAPLKHVSAAQIRAAVHPFLASGFFAIDLDGVQQAVAALPWVAHDEVRRHWPDTLTVQVTEQRPFAHWDDDVLINDRGGLYSVPSAAALQGLPHLSGPAAQRAGVVAFYLAARKAFDARGLRVDGVHLSDRGAWRIDLADGAQVMVGRTRPQRRLDRFLDTYPTLIRGHRGFAYVDLRYPNGYAVRWMPAAPAAPTQTEPNPA